MRYVVKIHNYRHVIEVPDYDYAEMVIIARSDGNGLPETDLVGIDLTTTEVVVGHWPDGEEWVDEFDVPAEHREI